MGAETLFRKTVDTVFIVKNIAQTKKVVRLFNYPILWQGERDLLSIPYVSESDIRHSLLKGSLAVKLKANEITIVRSNIDLIQFDEEQKDFLSNHGVNYGTTPTIIGGEISSEQHNRLRTLIHLADGVGGPMEGFASNAVRETLPVASAFPTNIIWWESSEKTKKIIEKTITWNEESNPTIISWKVYDEDGSTVLATITDTISYSGPFETTRTRVIS